MTEQRDADCGIDSGARAKVTLLVCWNDSSYAGVFVIGCHIVAVTVTLLSGRVQARNQNIKPPDQLAAGCDMWESGRAKQVELEQVVVKMPTKASDTSKGGE